MTDKEDLTIYEEDLVGYIDKPRGVEYSTLPNMEQDSNWLLYTGVSYLGAAMIGGTVGFTQGILDNRSYGNGFKSKIKGIAELTGKRAAGTANLCASTVFTFGLIKRVISSAFEIHEESIVSSTASGVTVGIVYNAPRGYVKALAGGCLGGVLGFLTSLTARNVVYK